MSTHCNCPHLLSWHGTTGCTWAVCGCRFARWVEARPTLREVHGAEKGSVENAAGVTAARVYVAEWLDAEAPPPSGSEGGAVSAIADHSTEGISGPPAIPAADAGGGTYSTEPRRTLHGPTVEAAGDAHPSYRQGLQTHEHRLVRELAAALLDLRANPIAEGLSRRFLDAAYAVAALVPVLHCAGCDTDFLQMDGRNTMWCSERCRSRVGQRARRSRLKAEAAGKPARCDPSRGIHVRPHTAETGCVPRPVSPLTASTDGAK